MTEDRLLRFFSERKTWQSYQAISKHFGITESNVQKTIKKMERSGKVRFKFGENGKKLWQLTHDV